MSNKLTRKSLAFGAMVALASSAIAGAPAQAAGEVVFAPTSGTSYNTFVTEQISLTASLAPGQVAGNITQLKYKIDSATASTVNYNVGATVATPATLAAATSVVASAGAVVGTANVITLQLVTSTAATATTSVTVTAFIDSNNDNLLTAGEFEQARTVKFVKYSEVVPTVAITSAGLAGDTSVKATASYGDINVQQLTATDLYVKFTTAGATAAGVNAVSGVYTDTVTALVAAGTVTAQAKYKTELLGTAVSQTVAAQTIATVVGALVEGPDAKVLTGPTARLNTAFSVKATVKDNAATPKAVAGVAVTAAITTNATLGTNITLSVNGTVYNSATLPTALALTSDANGEVKVDLKSVGFVDAETVTVVFTSQNIVATGVTVTQKATAYAITADDGNLYSTPLGTPVSVALSVKDQFGTLSTKSDRIAVTTTSAITAFTAGTTYVAVSGGKATYSATSGTGTAAGQISLATALEAQNASTLNWAPYATPVTGTAILVNVTTAANSFTTAPAATATAKVNADAYTSAISTTAGYSATYAVVVANPGTMVTVAAPGAYVKVGSTFGEGTATARSDAAGAVSVAVYFHTVGSATVTFTNGTAVKTSVVTVTTDLLPAKVSLTTPAQAQVGQALDVVVTVTDKWDNAVATPAAVGAGNLGFLTLSSTGTGYFASSSAVANAAGKATVKYIVGTADIGTAFLSATLDLATDVTAAKSIEFGLTDGDVLAGGKRVFVSAEFAKGRTVSVSINGKRIYSKVQTTDNAVELAFTQRRAGTYTVTVRISGGIVFTEKVTVG